MSPGVLVLRLQKKEWVIEGGGVREKCTTRVPIKLSHEYQ